MGLPHPQSSLYLDALHVLIRTKLVNYAVRGYPLGFVAPPSSNGLDMDELHLYHLLRFTITYQEDPSAFEGVHITGFDVHPVSIEYQHDGEETNASSTTISTCNKPGAWGFANNLLESSLAYRTYRGTPQGRVLLRSRVGCVRFEMGRQVGCLHDWIIS